MKLTDDISTQYQKGLLKLLQREEPLARIPVCQSSVLFVFHFVLIVTNFLADYSFYRTGVKLIFASRNLEIQFKNIDHIQYDKLITIIKLVKKYTLRPFSLFDFAFLSF